MMLIYNGAADSVGLPLPIWGEGGGEGVTVGSMLIERPKPLTPPLSLRATAVMSLIRVIDTFRSPCQESWREDFTIPEGFAAVIHCRRSNEREAAMSRDEGFHIGFFGDVRREEAGATLFERVVVTGSLVLHEVGGDRAG